MISFPIGQMREANMIAEHVNYLLFSEIIFCCTLISGIILTALCYIYMNYYVNGERLAKIIFQLCYFIDVCTGLFLSSIMGIFYIAVQIKFTLLNDYFK